MGTVTHGLIGARTSRIGFHQRTGRAATIAFLIGAIFPDIDMMVSFLGPDAALRHHRGVTHSLVCAPLFALLLSWAIYKLSSFKCLRLLYPMVLLGMISHIFFDLITSYGTVIFDPIIQKRYSLNLVFILDPFITLPVLAGLILLWKRRLPPLKTALVLYAYLALYLVACFGLKLNAQDRLFEFAAARGIEVKRATVYPSVFAPLFWFGVIDDGQSYHRAELSSFNGSVAGYADIRKDDSAHLVEVAKNTRVGKLYYWFADYPISRYRIESGRPVVEFSDARFRWPMESRRFPFVLKVEFDQRGVPTNIILNGRMVE